MKDPAISSAFELIESFTRSVQTHSIGPYRSLATDAFQVLEYPLHLARVAYENDDIAALQKIQAALKHRWVQAKKDLETAAEPFEAMFAQMERRYDEEVGNTGRINRAVLHLPGQARKRKRQGREVWLDLDALDDAPKLSDIGVTVERVGIRVKIHQGIRVWTRLINPSVATRLGPSFFKEIQN